MSTDARIAVTFRTHTKRVKLQRRLGADGVLAFVDLILNTAATRPDGNLSGMTHEDIAIAAQWGGDPEEFVRALVDLRFLDYSEHDGFYALHDWDHHNEWASKTEDRRHAAKVNAHIGWLRRKGTACYVKGCKLCRSYATSIAQSKATSNAQSNAPLLSTLRNKKTPTTQPEKEPTKRKTRLPEDWMPKPATRDWAAKSFPGVPFDAELAKFRDWYIGTGALWLDWDRCLMGWIRRAASRMPSAARNTPVRESKFSDVAELFGRGDK